MFEPLNVVPLIVMRLVGGCSIDGEVSLWIARRKKTAGIQFYIKRIVKILISEFHLKFYSSSVVPICSIISYLGRMGGVAGLPAFTHRRLKVLAASLSIFQ